jgi:hypothetical protein
VVVIPSREKPKIGISAIKKLGKFTFDCSAPEINVTNCRTKNTENKEKLAVKK